MVPTFSVLSFRPSGDCHVKPNPNSLFFFILGSGHWPVPTWVQMLTCINIEVSSTNTDQIRSGHASPPFNHENQADAVVNVVGYNSFLFLDVGNLSLNFVSRNNMIFFKE